MKKILFGLIATVMISVSGFANNDLNESIIVKKEVNAKIENCKDKINVSFNLGDVTNLSKSEVNILCDNLILQNVDFKDADECTVSISAEINVGFGSVSITVSYTSTNCTTALNKAKAALANAVKALKDAY